MRVCRVAQISISTFAARLKTHVSAPPSPHTHMMRLFYRAQETLALCVCSWVRTRKGALICVLRRKMKESEVSRRRFFWFCIYFHLLGSAQTCAVLLVCDLFVDVRLSHVMRVSSIFLSLIELEICQYKQTHAHLSMFNLFM